MNTNAPLFFTLSTADLCKYSFLMNKTNNRAAMKSSGGKRTHSYPLFINNFLFNFPSPMQIQQVQNDMKTDRTYWILKILISMCTS